MFSASTTTVNGTYNAASTTVNGGTANLAGTITGLGATSISRGTLNINGATTTATSLTKSRRNAERAWGTDGDGNDELLGDQHRHRQQSDDE